MKPVNMRDRYCNKELTSLLNTHCYSFECEKSVLKPSFSYDLYVKTRRCGHTDRTEMNRLFFSGQMMLCYKQCITLPTCLTVVCEIWHSMQYLKGPRCTARNSGPPDKRGNLAPQPICVEKHSITWHLWEGPHQVRGPSPPPSHSKSKSDLSPSRLLYFIHLQS